MKAYRGMKVYLHTFLTLALDNGDWSALWPSHITTRETADRIGDWVDPKTDLEPLEKRKKCVPALSFKLVVYLMSKRGMHMKLGMEIDCRHMYICNNKNVTHQYTTFFAVNIKQTFTAW
jgi:hypothetical protein